MDPADGELLDQAVAGDKKSLGLLLERFGPQVRERLKIAPKWASVLEADDVMQVTYLEAYLRIRDFVPRGDGTFVRWLHSIAQNNLCDAIEELGRIKRPQPEQRLRRPVAAAKEDHSSQQLLLELAGRSTTTPRTRAGRIEATSLLGNAIRKLPPSYREVVEGCDLEGQPAADVAARMGRSRAAVYMIRARAHDHLRESLGASSKFFSGSNRVVRS